MLYNKIQSAAVSTCNWSEVLVDVIQNEKFHSHSARCYLSLRMGMGLEMGSNE